MKIWLVGMVNRREPEQKVYLLGAYSSRDDAVRHQVEIGQGEEQMAHVFPMELDGPQSPVLVGVARSELPDDCKKNTPNG